MIQPLLAVEGLMMRFGGLLAVNNVALELRPQEIVSLIGPNGAGKTTVFNCLTGFTSQPAGRSHCVSSIWKGCRARRLRGWASCGRSSMCVCSVR